MTAFAPNVSWIPINI